MLPITTQYIMKKFKIAIKEHKLNSADLIDNFINKVNKESNFNKTIVFIAGKCYPMMARQAAFLRKMVSKHSLFQWET